MDNTINWIDHSTPKEELQQLLESKGWLRNEQIVAIEKAGEGNMNMVMKVTTSQRTVVLKQPRPYVFKYPEVAAPQNRIFTEFRFHEAIGNTALLGRVPDVLQFDKEDHLMMLDFIDDARDMIYLYQDRIVPPEVFSSLMDSLNVLHGNSVPEYPSNLELRKLNHQHIFHLPFVKDNGFSLDAIQPGLQSLAAPFKADIRLQGKVEQLGLKYLSEGSILLHGDYYPGSWMHTRDQIYLIDPEFSHLGFCEYDLGVMTAHLIMISGDDQYLEQVIRAYGHQCDKELVAQMAGTEIIRRLIGLAQLPLVRTIEEKAQLLDTARNLLLF